MSLFTKRYHTPGTAPGTLISIAGSEERHFSMTLVDYNADRIEVLRDAGVEDCKDRLQRKSVTWLHVHGHIEPETLVEIGDIFRLHPLALEDVLNVGQRPKADIEEDQIFVVASWPSLCDGNARVEQVSLFCGPGYLVSFCTADDNFLKPIYSQLQAKAGRIRKRDAAYLMYVLLDLIIDQGFPVMESFGERLEQLEEFLLATPDKQALTDLHFIKRELLLLRRSLWPQREMINSLLHCDEQIGDETKRYLQDCYDHTIQIMDLLETYRDITGGMLDIYLSSVSYHLNEVMRVLTIIATLFIPPTFIVGVYGMNFRPEAGPLSMPELAWPLGYLGVWGVILIMVSGMLVYFKRKSWF